MALGIPTSWKRGPDRGTATEVSRRFPIYSATGGEVIDCVLDSGAVVDFEIDVQTRHFAAIENRICDAGNVTLICCAIVGGVIDCVLDSVAMMDFAIDVQPRDFAATE